MRLIYLFILIFGIISCQQAINEEIVTPKTIFTPKDSTSISWLALGDSYTIGQGVNQADRFPAQTLALLKTKYIRTQRLTYVAKTGWTSYDLLKSMAEQNLEGHDFVSLLIGVNDQYQGIDTSIYRKNFTVILNRAIELMGGDQGRVVVLSIPDYSDTPIGRQLDTLKIKKEIDLFNGINKKIAMENKCQYLNITEIGRNAKNNSEWVAFDGLHPSALAYRKWSELIYATFLSF